MRKFTPRQQAALATVAALVVTKMLVKNPTPSAAANPSAATRAGAQAAAVLPALDCFSTLTTCPGLTPVTWSGLEGAHRFAVASQLALERLFSALPGRLFGRVRSI